MENEDKIKKLTIFRMMEMVKDNIPNREMFVFPETGMRYTYDEFNKKVADVSRSLIAMGVGKSDHVGLWMDSIEEWYILFYACNKIGAISVPINTGSKSYEINIILKNFDIDYLFMTKGFDGNYPNHIKKIIPEMKTPNDEYPRLKKIISIGFEEDNCINYDDFIDKGSNVSIDEVNHYYNNTSSDDICIILPTSGTTGIPKGVELNNIQLIRNGFDIGERYKLNGFDKMLIQVPMFHCFGITLSMLAALTHCTTMCVISHFKASVAIKTIETEKITCMNGVPTMYRSILENDAFDTIDFSSLIKGIMAGSNCLPSLIEEVEEKIGMKIISVYGLSEASPGCTMSSVNDSKDIRTYTVGSSLPEIECKIIDPITSEECPIGVRGEFVVRGYNVMNGYYNDSGMTDRVIDSNGFLHTGDIALKRDDGTYEITGRIKDTIIRGGENIYPKEVEMIINQCPGVVDSCVFGVDDPIFDQEVAACVITDGDVIVDDIRSFMKEMGAKYKIPKYFVIVDEFIKNAAGKVRVAEMAKVYSKKIGINY